MSNCFPVHSSEDFVLLLFSANARLSGSGSFATDVDNFIPDNKILLLYLAFVIFYTDFAKMDYTCVY
jgi:hypothetical protein